jgi:predicted transcriptional regulator
VKPLGVTTLPRRHTVVDVMTCRVHVARPNTASNLLAQLIEENKISAVPIVDEHGVPVGIVSQSDLLLKKLGLVASEVMTTPPITVRSNTTLARAARLMEQRNVGLLVVVDDRGRIAGIVSRSDLAHVSSERTRTGHAPFKSGPFGTGAGKSTGRSLRLA